MSRKIWLAMAAAVLVLTLVASSTGPLSIGVEYATLTVAP